ncbi:hypothetical protein FGAF467_15430 [Escherichia coli]|nr:hypothetical protein FGAF467_15430 [Escherichia coli]
MKHFFLAAALVLSGCVTVRPYYYKIDYPINAARLSLGGEARVLINCDTREVDIVFDTSKGIFGRHIRNRVNSICYQRKGPIDIIYRFEPVSVDGQSMSAIMHP